jgi:hypothetical protein
MDVFGRSYAWQTIPQVTCPQNCPQVLEYMYVPGKLPTVGVGGGVGNLNYK